MDRYTLPGGGIIYQEYNRNSSNIRMDDSPYICRASVIYTFVILFCEDYANKIAYTCGIKSFRFERTIIEFGMARNKYANI